MCDTELINQPLERHFTTRQKGWLLNLGICENLLPAICPGATIWKIVSNYTVVHWSEIVKKFIVLHRQAEIYLVRSLCKPRRRKTLKFSAFESKLLRRIHFTDTRHSQFTAPDQEEIRMRLVGVC